VKLLRFVPDNTHYDFIGKRYYAFAFTATLFLITIISIAVRGFNFGIDFKGGVLLEVAQQQAFELSPLRSKLSDLGLGEVSLQTFGKPTDLLIRIEKQPGGDAAQQAAVDKIKAALGPGIEYRRVEIVGPKVSGELLFKGYLAAALAVVAISAYVAIRFEWQFGVAALIATLHDVVTTMGVFSVLGLEFDLTAIAAILTIAGYSINDTVVVFDRIRENLRKYKTMPLAELFNLSVNETLSRTIMTSSTTMLAVLALLVVGGPVILNFNVAMAWGIITGTYSSIYVAAALLLYVKPLRRAAAQGTERAATSAKPPAKGRPAGS
jgi:preprotein translocase subunit SecF